MATPESDRDRRILEIQEAAEVRHCLGQCALHRLVDGRHVVTVRGRVVVADDLQEAIRLAKEPQ